MGSNNALKSVAYFFMGLIILVLVVGLIVLFPTHAGHQTILEYLRVVLSWPGVALLLTIIVLLFIRSIISPDKTKIIYEEKPKVAFIKIEGKTEDGNLIINPQNYSIEDGDVVVNKGFIMKFLDHKMKVESLESELKRYREKLLEK